MAEIKIGIPKLNTIGAYYHPPIDEIRLKLSPKNITKKDTAWLYYEDDDCYIEIDIAEIIMHTIIHETIHEVLLKKIGNHATHKFDNIPFYEVIQ